MSQILNNETKTVKNLWKICQYTLIKTPTREHGTSASGITTAVIALSVR